MYGMAWKVEIMVAGGSPFVFTDDSHQLDLQSDRING